MTKLDNLMAFNINFDSLNEAFGFPKNFRDPSFFEVYDRFNSFAQQYNFKYSIYVIGKDLENPEFAARIKEWHQQGHEIGNHTWSHPTNLGALSEEEIRREVWLAHEKISEITGEEPRGFIAPAWSSSKRLWNILIDNNYFYDTSLFTSYLLYPMVLKMLLNHRGNKVRQRKIISRKDWLTPFKKNDKPFIYKRDSKKLVVLPLPTTNWLKIGYWHTLSFLLSEKLSKTVLQKILQKKTSFYYLLHPADLLSQNDIDGTYENYLERMDISIEQKENAVSSMFHCCFESGRKPVLMHEIAKTALKQLK